MLEEWYDTAKYQKEMKLHMYIVQPGFAKAHASGDILLLLGTAYHYPATVGNVELKVYAG